jgi:hypothetical protein
LSPNSADSFRDFENLALIARMDADDVALPQRIFEQLGYFSMYPDTDVVSSDVSYIGTHDHQLLFNPTPFRFSESGLPFPEVLREPVQSPDRDGASRDLCDTR